MTLNNYEWKQDKEDEQGYYFVLTDTFHHLDYNVLLIKDNGQIMVNGDYINNVPQSLAAAIAPRIDYFLALKRLKHHNEGQHHTETKKPEKKEDKKPEAKKSEKKPEKKEDKKSEKKEDKKPEKKEDKKGKK